MVKILHLYYDLMNLYGEYGNITVLCDNLKKNGIDYELKKYSIGDEFEFDDFDFIYCGSGTESKTELAIKDFINRKDSFNKALNNNKYILFTGSSIKLLGKESINVFDYSVKNENKRICGDIICECGEYKDIVGYVNTSYMIDCQEEYFITTKTETSLKNYKGLGFKKNNLLTINITGPLLIKNPHILKDLIIKLGLLNNKNFEYKDTISKYQYMGYSITFEQLNIRFN